MENCFVFYCDLFEIVSSCLRDNILLKLFSNLIFDYSKGLLCQITTHTRKKTSNNNFTLNAGFVNLIIIQALAISLDQSELFLQVCIVLFVV